MSFKGQLLKAGISSDGKVVDIYHNDGKFKVTTASTETSGTIRNTELTHTVQANSMSLINETLRVSLESEYYTGDWANAIVGRIDYGDAGDARGGMAAAICAEMNMPAKSYASIGGPCYALDCEFNCPTSFVAGERSTYPIGFIKFGAWGGAVGQFDDEGCLFHVDGLTAGSGHLLSANSRTLRVNIGGTEKYVYLSDTEDDLGAMVVDSITLAPGTGVTGLNINPTIAAGSFLGISVAPTLSGQQTQAIGIQVDYNYSGGDINAYGIDVDIQQTGETSGSPALGSRGNIQALRSDARAAYTIDDCYALRGSCYVLMAAAEEANDCVGVFGTIQHTGTITAAASTSAMCAMKADVSNGCTGSYDGQMFGLMIGYGSSINYGSTSALIFGYTHADARADYGVYVLNYSPNMVTGLLLTQQNTSATMQTGIDIDTNGLGADVNYYGIDNDVTQRSVASGAYLSRGNMQGIRSDCAAIGNIDHVYAVRGDSTLVMAANTENNQFYGGLFHVNVSGAFTFTVHDMLAGISVGVIVDSGVTDVVTGAIRAAYFDSSSVAKDTTAEVSTVYVKAGGASYTDYALNLHIETNNITAAMMLKTFTSCVCPVGIYLNAASGSFTHAIKFANTNSGVVTNVADVAGDNTSHAIKVDIAGSTYYVPVYSSLWS